MTTIADALRDGAQRLASVTDTARLDAELLMAHHLQISRSDMLLFHARKDAQPHLGGYSQLVERRLAHEPIAYILGGQEFFGLLFQLAPGVLIPRADSETIVQACLDTARPDARVLDCGTGSGALLLAFLAQRPLASGIGIDASPAALACARGNGERLVPAPRAQFQAADWSRPGWAQDLGQFDLVMSNPPYVESNARLDASVREWEPHEALFAGPEGLDDYRLLIPQLRGLLTQNGLAVLEIGWQQAEAVSQIAAENGFDTHLYRDLAERPRALVLR